jgi:hypothetical protein
MAEFNRRGTERQNIDAYANLISEIKTRDRLKLHAASIPEVMAMRA